MSNEDTGRNEIDLCTAWGRLYTGVVWMSVLSVLASLILNCCGV